MNNADDSASAEGVLSSDIVTQAEKKVGKCLQFGYKSKPNLSLDYMAKWEAVFTGKISHLAPNIKET